MKTFTVSFFGHRDFNEFFAIEEKLEKIIQELLHTKEYVEFLVGRDGEFDRFAASIIRKCKQTIRNDNSALVLVLPYTTAEYKHNANALCKYYDEIEVCHLSSSSHFKAAHQIRNRTMVDRSNFVVFYVHHPSGGAYHTMRYAEKIGINKVNLAE